MWAILYNGGSIISTAAAKAIVIGSSWTTPSDELDCMFSLFRAPNEVIWNSKEPGKSAAKNMKFGDPIRLILFRRDLNLPSKTLDAKEVLSLVANKNPNIIADLHLCLESKNWHQGMFRKHDGLELRFVPASKFYAENNEGYFFFGGQKVNARIKLRPVFNKLEEKINNSKTIKSIKIISDTVTEAIEYRSFMSMSNSLDTIDKIAVDNGLEYFYGDNEIYIGKQINNHIPGTPIPDKFKYNDSNMYNNTSFQNAFKYKLPYPPYTEMNISVDSGGFPDTMPLPGTVIELFGFPRRIIYNNISFNSKGSYSSFITIETVSVSKTLMYKLLPDKARRKLSTELDYKIPDIMFGKVKKYMNMASESSRQFTDFNVQYNNSDPEELAFDDSITKFPVTYFSTPYAGEQVGVQYPENLEAAVVAVCPDGKNESMTSVGQIYQNRKAPKRDEKKDYRLTVPNAGTVYYDQSKKVWYIASKRMCVMGIGSSIVDTKAPLRTQMTSYIQIGDGDTDDQKKIVITTGDRTITVDNLTVNVT